MWKLGIYSAFIFHSHLFLKTNNMRSDQFLGSYRLISTCFQYLSYMVRLRVCSVISLSVSFFVSGFLTSDSAGRCSWRVVTLLFSFLRVTSIFTGTIHGWSTYHACYGYAIWSCSNNLIFWHNLLSESLIAVNNLVMPYLGELWAFNYHIQVAVNWSWCMGLFLFLDHGLSCRNEAYYYLPYIWNNQYYSTLLYYLDKIYDEWMLAFLMRTWLIMN